MNSLNWDDLRIFLAAAEAGSLSAAARKLGLGQPTVGRRIAALETSLGTPLFQRHAQGLTLTEHGAQVLEHAGAMRDAAGGLARRIAGAEELDGTVRLSAPPGLASLVIAPALEGFYQRHPRLRLLLQASDQSADLARGEADVALRLFRPNLADLVVQRIGQLEFGLYASLDYASRFGLPASRTDLGTHRLIGYGDTHMNAAENRWLMSLSGETPFLLASDCTFTRLNAARAGIGLAVLPKLIAGTDPTLTEVVLEIRIPARPIWLVVHRDLRPVAKVRAVMDFLVSQVVPTA